METTERINLRSKSRRQRADIVRRFAGQICEITFESDSGEQVVVGRVLGPSVAAVRDRSTGDLVIGHVDGRRHGWSVDGVFYPFQSIGLVRLRAITPAERKS
jgi:hypothetical protein